MPTHLQKAKMTQQKVKLTKKDKKEVRRDNLKKAVKKKNNQPKKVKPSRRY
jgi:hypothetical protein